MLGLSVDQWWVILTGFLAAASCGLLGCYLVLRRLSMLGDAISHAVLPGIVIAFALTGSRVGLPMLVGAGALGLLTAAAVSLLERSRRVAPDAAIGIVFTSLFAVGVLLLACLGDNVDLDQDCVLYGEMIFVPFDILIVRGTTIGPRATVVLAGLFVAVIIFVVTMWKELLVSAFDAPFATTLGYSALAVHYALMAMVSVSVVGAFEAVGAILVVAMLVAPGATAYLLVDRVSTMLMLSVVVSAVAAFAGYGLSIALNCSPAGAMAVAAGGCFVVALLCSPRHGLLVRAYGQLHLMVRIGAENLLGALQRAEERSQPTPCLSALRAQFHWSALTAAWVVRHCRRRGWLEARSLALSDGGRDQAAALRQVHRAWQSELEALGYDREHAHASAHRLEHTTAPGQVVAPGERP